MNENIFKIYSEHRHLYIFKTNKGSVLFKPLEYNKCRIAERVCQEYPALSVQIEDNIWEECVIEHSFPSRLYDLDAGIVSTVVRVILRISAPKDVEEIKSDLGKARESIKDIRDEIVAKICEAFPAYTPEEVEEMDWPTQIKRLAQAEKVLGTELSVQSEKAANGNIPEAPSGIKMRTGEDGSQYIDFAEENAYIRDGD